MLPLLRTILLLLWFRNFSEVYDFNLMTLVLGKILMCEDPAVFLAGFEIIEYSFAFEGNHCRKKKIAQQIQNPVHHQKTSLNPLQSMCAETVRRCRTEYDRE